MKRVLILAFFLTCCFPLYSQSRVKSRDLIDYLKNNLSYPKYNVGDTVFIWYQAYEDQPANYQPGVVVRKCVIGDIVMCNGGAIGHSNTFSLMYCVPNPHGDSYNILYKTSFEYQVLPCDVKQIVGNYFPVLRSEDSLFETYEECKKDSQKEIRI